MEIKATVFVRPGETPKEALDRTIKRIEQASPVIARVMVDHAVLRAPVDTGALKGSLGGAWTKGTRGVSVAVVSPLEHAQTMERGMQPRGEMPNMPPTVEELLPWVRRVLRVRGSKARFVAFRVALKIAKKGLEARRYAQRGLDAAMPRILQIIKTEIER